MRNFQETFETRKQSFTSAFSICMTVPLNLRDYSDYLISNFHKYHIRFKRDHRALSAPNLQKSLS